MKGKHAKPRRWPKGLAFGVAAALAMAGLAPVTAQATAAHADSSGIDVSSNNGTLNYGVVAGSGQKFVIVKVNQGTYVWGGRIAAVSGARSNGMAVGYYDYISCRSGASEADIFNANLNDYRTGDPLVLDYEGACATPARANAWMQRMRQLRPTGNLYIYMSTSVANGPTSFATVRSYGARLWAANYGSNNGTNHGWPYTPAWTQPIHQYTSNGWVDGRRVDMNVAKSDAWSGSALPASANTSTGTQVSASSATYNGYSVRTIQTLLGKAGFYTAIDGVYGADTTAKVRSFQSANGLVVDGIVGAKTWAALNKVYVDGWIGPISIRKAQLLAGTSIDGVISGQSALARAHTPAITSKTTGTSGSLFVRALQRRLGVAVDGQLGPQTVRALQRRLGVTSDGVLGNVTAKAWQRKLQAGKLF